MKARRFYLFKRNNIYYAQLRNPLTNQLMTAKSTGKRDYDDATYEALSWLRNGIPSGRTRTKTQPEAAFRIDELLFQLRTIELTENDTSRIIEILKKRGLIADAQQKKSAYSLIDYFSKYWDYDKSLYVKEKLSHGHSIKRSYTNGMRNYIKNYWKPYFNDLSITALTPQMLKEFSIHISNIEKTSPKGKPLGENLSFQSLNLILKAGIGPLKWAVKNGVIQSNPAKDIMFFAGTPKKRGILTDKEINSLFTKGEWKGNESAKLASMLSLVTGLRASEIIALRVKDILKDRIHVRYSYSPVDGFKTPKNGEERQVPILPSMRKQLIDNAKRSPLPYTKDSLIFWLHEAPEKPMRRDTISMRFASAVNSIGIKERERKSRGITFHSFRHAYATKMTTALDQRTARLTGHKTASMLEHYANHQTEEDFQKAIDATDQIFGTILQFKSEVTA